MAASAVSVMKDLSEPSNDVMRSRCALTTSTGDTCLPAIRRASSPAEAKVSSAISEHPVLRCRLHVGEWEVVEAGEQPQRRFHHRPERLELRIAPVETGHARGPAEGIEIDRSAHGRQSSIGWSSGLMLEPGRLP